MTGRNGAGHCEHLLAMGSANRRDAERQCTADDKQHPGHDPGHQPTPPCTTEGEAGLWRRAALNAPFPFDKEFRLP